MSTVMLADARRYPRLFLWHGRPNEQELARVVGALGVRLLPADLIEFWRVTGGGELFETETLLAPVSSQDPSILDVVGVNERQWAQGLSKQYVIFHVGLGGFSAIRLIDGRYVVLEESTFGERRTFACLDEWYEQFLRAEYADRYGLAPSTE